MSVSIERHLDDRTMDALVQLYTDAFAPLRTATATRQTLYDHELRGLLCHDAATTFVVRSPDGLPRGFALTVTDLKLIPWINPEFFAARFPDHYATGRIAYQPALAVTDGHRSAANLLLLNRAMGEHFAPHDMIIAFDCCTEVITKGLPEFGAQAWSRMHDVTIGAIDQQVYWAIHLRPGTGSLERFDTIDGPWSSAASSTPPAEDGEVIIDLRDRASGGVVDRSTHDAGTPS